MEASRLAKEGSHRGEVDKSVLRNQHMREGAGKACLRSSHSRSLSSSGGESSSFHRKSAFAYIHPLHNVNLQKNFNYPNKIKTKVSAVSIVI